MINPNWRSEKITLGELYEYCKREMCNVCTHDEEAVLERLIKHFTPATLEDDKYEFNLKVCPQCNGFGLIQIAPNIRGLEICPTCEGSGNV